MHIEKNVFNSITGPLLNIPGKTKDSLASCLDLVKIGVRPELAPRFSDKRTYLPAACYNLKKKTRSVKYMRLTNIKVSYGYSSNIHNLFSIKDLRLIGLRSNDCHTLKQQLLSIALRAID